MFDYHVHTNFSADSSMPMEEACKQAIQMGVKEIAFTEHMDYFYPNCDLIFEFNYEEYAQKVNEVRKEFQNLTILKAVEIGLHPSVYKKSKKFTDENEFDFIIGSAHIVDDLDLHNGDYFQNKTLDEAIEIYFQTVYQYVKEYENFNVLGHLTLIKRYLHYLDTYWTSVDWTKYYDIISETFKRLIESSRGIEVNISGYRYHIDCTLPNLPFLKLYKDLGGEIITVGTDAHSKQYVGKDLKLGYELLQEAGFQYVTTFKERKPSFHKIADVLK